MSDEVEITNHRADATQNESLIGIARMGADAFGYTAKLRIDRGLAQLLRLRVSQLNNCSYCLNLHYEAARDAGIPRAKIDTLTAWWETDLHSEAEQAALRYAEALTRSADTDAGQAFQRFHDGLAKHFDAEKILVLRLTVGYRPLPPVSVDDPGEVSNPAKSHLRCCRVDGDAELGRVSVGLVAWDEEVLGASWLEGDEESHFLATHGESVRQVLRERRV
jgi:AhpD family alkylhydroperoxidase